jgi:transposase-like protein
MKRNAARRRRSPNEIREILEDYRRSGLSQSKFCERRGLALSTLTYWLSKDRKRSAGDPSQKSLARRQLVPVQIVDRARPQNSHNLEVESAHGYLLRFPSGLDPALLAKYMHALEDRC